MVQRIGNNHKSHYVTDAVPRTIRLLESDTQFTRIPGSWIKKSFFPFKTPANCICRSIKNSSCRGRSSDYFQKKTGKIGNFSGVCPGASYLMNPLTQSLTGKIEKRFFFLLIFLVIRFFEQGQRAGNDAQKTSYKHPTSSSMLLGLENCFYVYKFSRSNTSYCCLNNKHIHPFFLKR